MTRNPLQRSDLDKLLQAIPRILKSSSLDGSITEALELLRHGAGADAAVVFLADGDAPLREHWALHNPQVKASLRPRLKVEALEAIRKGGSHLTTADGVTPEGRATKTVLLSTESGPFGAAALIWSSAPVPSDPKTISWIVAVIEMVASTTVARGEIAKLRLQAERDKRWFKTLDDHLRVLDRERQKFAAVVNQTDTFVFVADEARIIRWNNRAMSVLLPSGGEGSSWVGKPCSEVCSRLGQRALGADSCDCPIRHALEMNEVTHQEMRVEIQGRSGVLYLTALPIKDLDGKPHEAMVLVQDLTGLETLRQSEVRTSVLFERNAEAILMADPETHRILLANPAAQRMLGYSPQELQGLSLQSLHSASDWERFGGFYGAAAKGNAPSRLECRVLTQEGKERIALVSSTRVELEGKSVDLVHLVDVTFSRLAEQALGESEARQGAMVEAALDAIIFMDHAGRILEFNPAAERIFGHKRDDVLGRDMAELIIPPGLRESHRRGMERHLATGETHVLGRRIEITGMRADGSEFPIELAIARISSNGPPVFTGFIRDITERKRAEHELRGTQERLRMVVAGSPVVLFATDRHGILTLSEGKGLERLGRHGGESVGKSIYELYGDYPDVIASIERCLAGEEFTASVDLGGVSFESYYAPVRDPEGQVVGLIGVATDITERKSLEVQLRHAQKMEAVGRLAGGVAHDFNNLLTVIKGHSEVLLARMPSGEPLRNSAEEIQKAGARGVLLTRQLLAFSRKDVATFEILDVPEVVRGVESLLQRLLGDDVRLVTKTSGTALSVRADRGQLEQVLANLAVNARDAMPHGGDLHIEVRESQVTGDDPKQAQNLPPGPYVLLAVSDQGTGMGPEVLAHLFEPFFTTKDQGKGTGLGLSVVYGIVRQTGGDILVESEVGRGSTFRILLPWSGGPSSSGAGGDAPVEAGSPAKGQATVLLAEDEEAVRALARDMLQYLGYEVLEASSGDEAIRVFERHRDAIRAVVTDIVMPGMSGVDLARHLVSMKPGLKVLLVSGYTKDSLADGFEEDGFAFLQKPYMLEEIRRGLADLLADSLAGDAGAPPSRRG
ncbi:MAG TPA: PAS domain S-box protein [Candidatus Eisenbacteria bacterium]